MVTDLTLLHSERPKLYTILVFLGTKGLKLVQNRVTVIKNKIMLEKVSIFPFDFKISSWSLVFGFLFLFWLGKHEQTIKLLLFYNL